MFKSVILGIIFIIAGVLAFVKPEIVWKLTEQWKSYRADEPSDLYLFSTRFGAVIFIVLGIAAVILPFVL